MTTRRCYQRGREIIGLASACLVAIGAAGVARGQTGTVISHQKISDTEGGFTGMLDNGDSLGGVLAPLGDLDGDGVGDVVVSAVKDDDGGPAAGAAWIMFLNSDGTVKAHQKISATSGGFTGALSAGDQFSDGLAALGDLDGDGVIDLAAGAPLDDDGAIDAGAIWILFLNTDGTVKGHQKISATTGGFTGDLDGDDQFGHKLALLGDLDADGVVDMAVGAPRDDDGVSGAGAVWILFLNTDGTVKAHQKISNTQGGFTGTLGFGDVFGGAVDSIGDLDADGVIDLIVGANNDDGGGTFRGAVWILFLNANGTVKTHQRISDDEGGFTGTLEDEDFFGVAVGSVGDLDGDGVLDVAVGARRDDDGGGDRGAVWILLLNTDGTVKSHQKISNTEGGFTGALDNVDTFGSAVVLLGDLDLDGARELAVGAPFDDDGGSDRGAVWVLSLESVPATPEAQLDQVAGDLLEIINDDPGAPLADKLADALASVETSLEELDKEPRDNQAAVGNLEGAVGSICDAVLDEGFDAAQGAQLMDDLAGVAMQLAVDAFVAAIALGGDPDEIDEAAMFLAEGDALRALGVAGDCEAFKDAVNAYKDALAKAESAIG